MDFTKLQKVAFFIFIIANIQLAKGKSCILTPKIEIHVVNNLSSESLDLRCQSKNDDIGEHTLAPNQDFSWSFCDALEENTLFFCHFRAGAKDKSFNVYESGVRSRCTKNVCTWIAKDDGIYFNGAVVYPW